MEEGVVLQFPPKTVFEVSFVLAIGEGGRQLQCNGVEVPCVNGVPNYDAQVVLVPTSLAQVLLSVVSDILLDVERKQERAIKLATG